MGNYHSIIQSIEILMHFCTLYSDWKALNTPQTLIYWVTVNAFAVSIQAALLQSVPISLLHKFYS